MSIKALCVTKTYPKGGRTVEALKCVSIDINEGSFTLIHGPAGSGKTTLVSLLAGLLPPTSGEIVFDRLRHSQARDSDMAEFRERYVGYIPQHPLFIRELSALENIVLPHAFGGGDIAALKSRARELLERLRLEDKADFRPWELSGGEMRMVMAARAILKRPLYLFADEPVAELDEARAESVLELFSELRVDGSAVVLATHERTHDGRGANQYELIDGRIRRCTRAGHARAKSPAGRSRSHTGRRPPPDSRSQPRSQPRRRKKGGTR